MNVIWREFDIIDILINFWLDMKLLFIFYSFFFDENNVEYYWICVLVNLMLILNVIF